MQKKVALFMIEGFEETEALATTDVLRRADIDVTLVSVGNGLLLKGRSGITAQADKMFADVSGENFDMLVIPGGTLAFTEHDGLLKLVEQYNAAGKPIAAICASPAVFAKLGLLKGKRAVIYPGMEDWLKNAGAAISQNIVETDGNITTSKGPGTTVYFALRLLEILRGKAVADAVAEEFIVQKIP